ncbi:hypothetical protein TEA_004773 [Camellia sinensis var. sinensis]|uniref:Ubiquitin-fold modifier-conjugating enzyme 1 n=1 Tax=Camellia sinensis var. sinensis TaxID=542762 RepID=A0A4S4D328_CAMSN|nr:hypothetical protein TEA_004773 [Camellia sinensis var. sinensis]
MERNKIPLLSTKAGPRDGAAWTQRLKEEYKSLIAYTSMNKSKDNDWFRISAANPEGTRWIGKCWYVHNLLKYEVDLQVDIPVTYPSTAPEIELPQLDGPEGWGSDILASRSQAFSGQYKLEAEWSGD